MKNRSCQSAWVAGLAIALTHSVWSQSTVYFDRGSFYTACLDLPGIQQWIWDFPWTGAPELTISNVTFQARYLGLDSSGEFLYNFDGSGPLGIQFANGARAFGGEFSSALSRITPSFTATVSLDDGETFKFTAPSAPDSKFFGIVSPTPIKEITFSDGGIYFGGMHQETIGGLYMVLEVPEPSALALAGAGAAMLLLRRRIAVRG